MADFLGRPTVADSWDELARLMLPPDVPWEVAATMRRTFYAGAAVMYAMLTTEAVKGTDAEALAYAEYIGRECSDFLAAIQENLV